MKLTKTKVRAVIRQIRKGAFAAPVEYPQADPGYRRRAGMCLCVR